MYTLKLTRGLIDDCTQPGQDAEPACRQYLELPTIKRQMNTIPKEHIRAYLSEYGAWDEQELADDEMNRVRLLWIAAGNAQDAIYNKEQAPCTVYISH